MKDNGSLHLVPLIYCKRVDEDSDFDIIIKKGSRIEAKEQTQLRDDKEAKMDNEEFCLIKKKKQAKKSHIEARLKDAFAYVKSYIKKDDGRTEIKRRVLGMKTLPCKTSTSAIPSVQLRPSSLETKEQ